MSGREDSSDTQDGQSKQLSLGIADFIETEPAGPATERVIDVRHRRSAAERPVAASPSQAAAELSVTRQRLLRQETSPQMVVVRLLEDAGWVQRRARGEFEGAEKTAERLSVLKVFWGVRTELVKMLQGLGVLPRELFFEDEETNLDDVPREVAETISGLLSGRLEPHEAAD